jgi:short-subunit dehydrogenase
MNALIVGASSGIGRELAIELDRRGARLMLAARRQRRLEALNRELGGRHVVHPADAGDAESVSSLMNAARTRFGRLDTLVCNASFGEIAAVGSTDGEAVRQMFACNVFGMLECVRHAVPIMSAQEPLDGWRGQIVIVSSAAARRAVPHFGVYCSTKAAQLSLAEALRVELRPRRIAVTSIHPIGTNTEFLRTAMRRNGARPPRRTLIEYRHSARQVACRIADAIESPRPELWTSGLFRFLMNLSTFFPGITDRILSRRMRPREKRAEIAESIALPGE